MGEYRALLFDLDNTILDFTKSQSETIRKVLELNSLPYENFYEVYKTNAKIVWSLIGAGTLREYNIKCWAKTLKEFGYTGTNFEKFSDDYKSYYAETTYLYNCSREVLQKLHKHFKMGVITNGDANLQTRRLQGARIYTAFDAFVFAENESRKPNTVGFVELLDKLKVTTGESLMVGDSLSEDYEPCKRLNIDFCWIKTKTNEHPAESDIDEPVWKTGGIDRVYKEIILRRKNKV